MLLLLLLLLFLLVRPPKTNILLSGHLRLPSQASDFRLESGGREEEK